MSGKSTDKIKQWRQRVNAGDYDGVNEDIEDCIIDYTVKEHSVAITNLLSQISKNAKKIDENERGKALKIYHISYTICSKIKLIDCQQYFPSLYWIIQTLFNNGLYDEAKSLSSYMSTGSLFHEQSPDPTSTYSNLSITWQKALRKWLLSLSRVEIEMKFNTLISHILFQLNYHKLANHNNSHMLIYYVKDYILIMINKKISQKFIDKAKQELVINTLSNFNLSLGNEEQYKIFETALSLINLMLIRDIDDDKLPSRSTIDKVFKIFDKCMSDNANYNKAFKFIQDTYTTFIRPVDEITDQVDAEITGLSVRLKKENRHLKELQSNDNKNGIQIVAIYIYNMINGMTNYWIRYYSSKNGEYDFKPATLLNTTKFGIELFKTFKLTMRPECNCGAINCKVKNEYHNSIKTSTKLINLGFNLYRKSTLKIPNEFIKIILLLSEDAIQLIAHLKSENCKLWSAMWSSLLISIFNFTTQLENNYYDDVCDFYSLMAATINNLDAHELSCFYNEDELPLAIILHRLTSAHYKREKYLEAMSVAALNIYLHYTNDNCKGFRLWISIKNKYKEAEEISVIERLKSDKLSIKESIGLSIKLNDTNTIEINLCEIKALCDASMNCSSLIMKILDSMEWNDIYYTKGVNYLGSHVLNFSTHKSINKYVKNALAIVKSQLNNSIDNNILKSNLKFYEFIEDLENVQNETDEEMKKLKISNIKIYATDADKEIDKNDAGPTGSKIDIDIAIKFSKQLEKIFSYWHDCFKDNKIDKIDETNGCLTLKNIITAAEFCRFHRYQDLEIKFWKLSHLLATKYNDYRSIVYITGRCISARCIKEEWIKQAENLIETKFDITKKIPAHINAIAIFKLSLSEYYYQSELSHTAEELFNEAMSLPTIEFMKSLGIYLYSLDITMTHRLHNFKNDKNSDKNHIKTFIEGIYTSASMWNGETLSNNRWSRTKLFYEIDCLLDFLCHVSLRFSQLLTSNDLLGNLIRRIPLVQKLANPLRTAEILKHLCFIDLSKEKLNDCEVKIQSIEHILKIEDIDILKKLKLSDTTCQKYSELNINYQSNYIIEPLRDLPRNDTSPVLRKKVFIMPEFSHHENNCKCFTCKNFFYKHLVLSSTHIRAQLHAFQNENLNSLEHFTGGFNVVTKLMDFSTDNKKHQYYHAVEYACYLIDYAKLLAKLLKNSDRAFKVVIQARDVCTKFHLEYHPIAVAVNNWLYENKCDYCIPEESKSSLCALDIDQQVLIEDATDRDSAVYHTPKRNIDSNMVTGRVINLKGKKLNPLLTLSKVNAIPTSVDEDDDDFDLIVNKIKERPIRRKFSDSEFLDGEVNEREEEKAPVKRENKFFKTSNLKGNSASSMSGDNLDFKKEKDPVKRENKFFKKSSLEVNFASSISGDNSDIKKEKKPVKRENKFFKISSSEVNSASSISGDNSDIKKEKKPVKREDKLFESVTISSSSSSVSGRGSKSSSDDNDGKKLNFIVKEEPKKDQQDITKFSTRNPRVTRSKNPELKTEKSSKQLKEKANKFFDASCDTPLNEFIDEVRAVFNKYGHVDQLSYVSVERKLNQLQVRDGTTKPANDRHIEVLLQILKDEKNESQTFYLDDSLNPTSSNSTENKIAAIDCLIDKLTKVIKVKNTIKVESSEQEGIFKDDSLDNVTERIEKISLAKKSVAKKSGDDNKSSGGVLKKKSQVIPDNSTDDVNSLTNEIEKISITKNKSSKVPVYLETSCELFSDDEVVEATIIEPRRSKRVASKKK